MGLAYRFELDLRLVWPAVVLDAHEPKRAELGEGAATALTSCAAQTQRTLRVRYTGAAKAGPTIGPLAAEPCVTFILRRALYAFSQIAAVG